MSALSRRGEDSFATLPNRPFRDVVDEANAICAAERARKWRLSIRYHVDYGYQAAHTQHFVEFEPAFAFYVDHLLDGAGPFQPRIVGYAFDESSDGLSSEEREAVEAARELAEVA